MEDLSTQECEYGMTLPKNEKYQYRRAPKKDYGEFSLTISVVSHTNKATQLIQVA